MTTQIHSFHDFFLSVQFMASLGLLIGVTVGYVLYRAGYTLVIKGAEFEAEDLIETAKDQQDLQAIEQKERTLEIEGELWAREEKWLLEIEERIEEMETVFQETKQRYDDRHSQVRKSAIDRESAVRSQEDRNKNHLKKIETRQTLAAQMKKDLIEGLSAHAEVAREHVVTQIKESLIQQRQQDFIGHSDKMEAEARDHSEERAKVILDRVFSRFQRTAPVERGIAPVYYETEQRKIDFLKLDPSLVKEVQDFCGCDVIVDPNMEMIGVAGFDPIRRELTRRVLERILKENKPGPRNPVTVDWLKKVSMNIKTEIFRMIKHDGDQIAKELRMEGLHPEIRQMMGSLKYRYSFTQNQFYHCGEVGFLCGLLAGELRGTEVRRARRAGLLHDLGKSMDHELEGGHAMIGADFIKARGEADDVVHAVRAHHYDEDPSTDMAFLVIAADAISGARPGARRSTVEAYNQKVSELQEIARSYPGVTDCFILSGGRECRVLVNSKKIDDWASLKMAGDIAKRIEAECNYPGQIKVVVVRETIATEQTMRTH